MIKGINAVLLHTCQMDAMIAFYRDKVGISLKVSNHGGGKHAEADLGEVHFAIFEGGPPPQDRQGVSFSLWVEDVEAEYRRMTALDVAFDSPPAPHGFGGILAPFRDPDGNGVMLMQWEG